MPYDRACWRTWSTKPGSRSSSTDTHAAPLHIERWCQGLYQHVVTLVRGDGRDAEQPRAGGGTRATSGTASTPGGATKTRSADSPYRSTQALAAPEAGGHDRGGHGQAVLPFRLSEVHGLVAERHVHQYDQPQPRR